ncbi:(p)ppGpp synthetase [Leptospira bourretii]|uniref:GTP pyrophosphokinase n=1 Tax=Leptospira bourretii TaxID=2484962 RepID=UPI00109162D1|nr:(p)ppGpp synthetase [Leptospira bourretii]TGL18590.1 (p)ppGpp synthetase [Leptospira bourretii]
MKEIIEEYLQNYKIIEANTKITFELINQLMNPLKIHALSYRIKERNSIEKKIIEKNKYNTLEDITDIIGIRIITNLNSDVDQVYKIIKENFAIDETNSIDKRNKKYNEFGYKSLHVVFSHKKEREILPEYKNCNKYKYEIQIRTILQHAWSEIEHDLGYKSDLQIPDEYKRTFYKISMLLEYADDEFEKINYQIREYRKQIPIANLTITNEIPINNETLKAYLQENKNIQKILEHISNLGYETDNTWNIHINLGDLADRLSFIEINSIKKLDDLIIKYEKLIPLCLKEFNTHFTLKGYFGLSAPIFYLVYILIANRGNDFINEFTNKFNKANSKVLDGLESIRNFIQKHGV